MHPLIEERSEGGSVNRLCHLAGVARSSYYRATKPPKESSVRRDEPLVQEIRSICEEMQNYGSPRVTVELRRRGLQVNHKRVSRAHAGK